MDKEWLSVSYHVCERNCLSFSRQQLANTLGKDLIDDSAGSGIHAPDGPVLASDMVHDGFI